MHAGIILVAVLCSIMAYNIFSVTREGLKAKKNKATSGKKPVVKKSKKSKKSNKSKTVFNVVATPTTIPAAATIAGPAAKTTVPVVYSIYTTKAVTDAAAGAAAFATAQSARESSSLARNNIDGAFTKAMSALEMSGSGLQADAKTSVKSAKDLAQKALDDAQTASDTFYTAADNVNLAASQTYEAAAAAKNNGASDYTTAMSLYETASNNNTTLTQTEMEVRSNLGYARAKFYTVSQIFDQINQN